MNYTFYRLPLAAFHPCVGGMYTAVAGGKIPEGFKVTDIFSEELFRVHSRGGLPCSLTALPVQGSIIRCSPFRSGKAFLFSPGRHGAGLFCQVLALPLAAAKS